MGAIIQPDSLNLRASDRPLSRSLESQLLAICRRPAPYRIEALALEHGAPESLADVLRQTALDIMPDDDGAGRLVNCYGMPIGERVPVSQAYSERTIWSCAAVNYLFRAWHDLTHVYLNAEFDLAGELRVARAQCAQIEGKPEKLLLWIEVAGQALYYDRHGQFPNDQRQFARDAIRHGLELTIDRGVYHAVR